MAHSEVVSNFSIIDETNDKVLLHFNKTYAAASKPPHAIAFSPALFISPDRYCPAAPLGVRRARNLLAPWYCVKRPQLEREGWNEDWGLVELKARTSREVKACEILKYIPHPNIATYHGCIITCGLISGIFYSLYDETLQERLNLTGKSKYEFQYQEAEQPLQSRARFLEGVEQGLLYLHSHRLVHNDVSPDSVMVSDELGVIIGFESCVSYGKSLKGVRRPMGWHDPSNQHSLYCNDFDALNELKGG